MFACNGNHELTHNASTGITGGFMHAMTTTTCLPIWMIGEAASRAGCYI